MTKAKAMQSWALAAVVVVATLSGTACDLAKSSSPTQPPARNLEFPETTVVSAAFSSQQSADPEDFTVIFTDLSTGNIETWHWDFGDGNTSTAQNPAHEYKTFGSYVVTLTVTNSISSDSVSQFVDIAEPPEEEPPPDGGLF